MKFEEAFYDELEKLAFMDNSGGYEDNDDREHRKSLDKFWGKAGKVIKGYSVGAVGGAGVGALVHHLRNKKLKKQIAKARGKEKDRLSNRLEKRELGKSMSAGGYIGALGGAAYGFLGGHKGIAKHFKRKGPPPGFGPSDRFKGML